MPTLDVSELNIIISVLGMSTFGLWERYTV